MKEIHIAMDSMPNIEGRINACIGYFDGIHKGHQQLIQTVVKKSLESGATPALITFSPDPWVVIKGICDVPHLTTMEDRKALAEKLGVELWIILDFTREMANLSIDQFHEQILFPLPLDTLVCGYDYHYAHFGKGDVSTLLAQTKFQVEVVAEVSSEHAKISSTRIEELLLCGEVEEAARLLTRPYFITGEIVSGRQNGRKMGFPTANLQMLTPYVVPKEGVYAGRVVIHDRMYDAMINIGKNPTFGDDMEVSIEANIFNFNETIYGETATFIFCSYIRGDIKFASIEQLITQLHQDQKQAQAILTNDRGGAFSCD